MTENETKRKAFFFQSSLNNTPPALSRRQRVAACGVDRHTKSSYTKNTFSHIFLPLRALCDDILSMKEHDKQTFGESVLCRCFVRLSLSFFSFRSR